MSSEDEFAQFEDDNAPAAPAAKAPAKKAAKAPAKKAAKRAGKKASAPAAETERDEAAQEAALQDRIDEATTESDTVTIKVSRTTQVPDMDARKADGGDPAAMKDLVLEFVTEIPRVAGNWPGKVFWLFNRGRNIEGVNLLIGDAEFERYLDIIDPKQSETADDLMAAIAKALGIENSGN